MKRIIYLLIPMLLIIGCEKNDFELSQNADEYFFLRNDGADMPVWVKGNTLSKTFIIALHGGPGGGSVGTYQAVKSFQIQENNYAVIYWDQRGAGITQGNYELSSINADQLVEDLEKLVVLIKNKYGNDISLFMQGGSWGGYLGFAYLTKDNNQSNIKGWICESGVHSVPLTGNAELRKMLEFGNYYIQNNVNKDEWTNVVKWCENMDTVTSTDHFDAANEKAWEVTKLLSESIAKDNIDNIEILKQSLFGPLSFVQAFVNTMQTGESPLARNFIDLDLSDELHKLTIPTLFIAGKYDLIVPEEVLYDAYNKISSKYKEIYVYDKSGHDPASTEAIKFAEDVANFIEGNK